MFRVEVFMNDMIEKINLAKVELAKLNKSIGNN